MRMGRVGKNSRTSTTTDLVETRAKTLLTVMILNFDLLGNLPSAEEAMIGTFHGVDALPEGEYPLVYQWIDSSANYKLCMSFNAPLFESMCHNASTVFRIPLTVAVISRTREIFLKALAEGFTKAAAEVYPGSSIEYHINSRQIHRSLNPE